MGRAPSQGGGAGAGPDGQPGPRVLVFAELGIGNLGNEASVAEALRRLDLHLPGAHVRVLSYAPERTAAEHRGEHSWWSVVPVRPAVLPRGVRRLPGRWGALALQVASARHVARASRDADVVVVPGTGIFEELWMGPWGVPLLLVGLAAGARAHRAPLAVVAVGADLPRRRLTRWMFSYVLRSASVVTFRDEHSLAAGNRMTGGRARRRATPRLDPDLVLGAPSRERLASVPPATAPGRPRLVLGVMRWFGTTDDEHDAEGRAVHERYLSTLVDVGERILARGWVLDVVVGDEGDVTVAHDLRERLGPGLSVHAVATVRDLDAVVADSTVVVASRYHNVVSAVRAAVPVVSVSYGAKGHALMTQVGLDAACQWIEELDADSLVAQIDDAVARSAEISARLRAAATALRAAADQPWHDVAALVEGRSPERHDHDAAALPAAAGA